MDEKLILHQSPGCRAGQFKEISGKYADHYHHENQDAGEYPGGWGKAQRRLLAFRFHR